MKTENMKEIGELIRTQDNCMTDQPIFIVQELIQDYGYSEDYADRFAWIDTMSGEEAEPEDAEMLDKIESDGEDVPENWEKVGYKERWQFVTACFTAEGCEAFIKLDWHNHGILRIYADSSYRNDEYRAVRDFLINL